MESLLVFWVCIASCFAVKVYVSQTPVNTLEYSNARIKFIFERHNISSKQNPYCQLLWYDPMDNENTATSIALVNNGHIVIEDKLKHNIKAVQTGNSTELDLIFRNITRFDTGKYKCETVIIDDSPVKGYDETHVTVNYLDVPTIKLPKEFQYGNTFDIVCESSAWPIPTLNLYKNHQIVHLVNNSSLKYTIGNLTREDEGDYYCTVSNTLYTAKKTGTRKVKVYCSGCDDEVDIDYITTTSFSFTTHDIVKNTMSIYQEQSRGSNSEVLIITMTLVAGCTIVVVMVSICITYNKRTDKNDSKKWNQIQTNSGKSTSRIMRISTTHLEETIPMSKDLSTQI